MPEIGERCNEVDTLMGFSGFPAKGFEISNRLIEDFRISDGGKKRAVVAHSSTGKGPEAREDGDMLTDQLYKVSAFHDGCACNSDIQPARYEIINEFFIINYSDQKVHVSLTTLMIR